MIREGHSELNIEINGGDVIFIPESGVFFVEGAVGRPGSYPIKRNIKLFEALTVAGGLKPYADGDSVILIRHLGDGERKVLDLDLITIGYHQYFRRHCGFRYYIRVVQ